MNAFLGLVLYTIGAVQKAPPVLAQHSISLENRYPDAWVNDIFSYNILHTLHRMEPTYSFSLTPGETFAFHDEVLPQFEGKVKKTTNAHFNAKDGFKSDGWLMGDGVCHLASLMYWAAKDAGLSTLAPTAHDFATIPQIPKEYGVSIFSHNKQQNLYITNTMDKPVAFTFNFDGTMLTLSVM